MNAFEQHGAFSWAELMTTDPIAARGFYGELFGWDFSEIQMNEGVTYHVVHAGDEKIAGIMPIPAEAAGAPPHWGNYVTVDDIDATADKVAGLGGSIIVPPTDIPGVGRFALFQDPQGATVAAITYSTEEN